MYKQIERWIKWLEENSIAPETKPLVVARNNEIVTLLRASIEKLDAGETSLEKVYKELLEKYHVEIRLNPYTRDYY